MKKVKLSATSIDKFISCPRSYYFRYISGIKEPTTKALQAGIDFHDCIEHILTEVPFKKDYPDSLLETVEEAFNLGVLGDHSENIEIEKKIDFQIDENFSMTGKIDLVDFDENCIQDHKSVGNWNYVETPESLKTNLQLLIYSYWYMNEFDVDEVKLRHNQIDKKDKENSKFVEATVTREEVFHFWNDKIVRLCKHIKKTREQEDADEVRTRNACSKYSGCHYAKIGKCDGHKISIKDFKK